MQERKSGNAKAVEDIIEKAVTLTGINNKFFYYSNQE